MTNLFFVCGLAFALFAACTSEPTDPNRASFGDVELIADQGTLPAGSNGLSVLTEKDKDTADVWGYFGFHGEAPSIEDDNEVALFIGTGESGSCPTELEGIQVDSGNVTFEVAEHDGNCTADSRPRSFVFLFPASNAPKVGHRVNLGPTMIESASAVLDKQLPPEVNLVFIPRVDEDSAPEFVVENRGDQPIDIGHEYTLSRRVDGTWRRLARCPFPQKGLTVPPGEISRLFPLVTCEGTKRGELEAGRYRVTKKYRLATGKGYFLRGVFSVSG